MADKFKHMLGINTVVIMLVLVSISVVSFGLSVRDQETYPSNYLIGDYRMDSVARADVRPLLPGLMTEHYGQGLSLNIENEKELTVIPISECGIAYDYDATLRQLDGQLFSGGFLGVLGHSIARGAFHGFQVKPVLELKDEALLNERLMKLKQSYDRPAVNASAWVAADGIKYAGEQDGRSLDVEATRGSVLSCLKAGSLGPVKAIVSIQPASLNSNDVDKIENLLGFSAGKLDSQNLSGMNELNNIRNSLNGLIIEPGGTMVINAVPGSGGGENNTYNASPESARIIAAAYRDAGLQVEERNGQTLISNPDSSPAMLWINIDGDTLIASIYGRQSDPNRVVSMVAEPDPTRSGSLIYYKDVKLGSGEKSRSLIYQETAGTDAGMEKPDNSVYHDLPDQQVYIPSFSGKVK